MQFHAVVWLDHRESRIFYFNSDSYEKKVIHASNNHLHLHHKSGSIGTGREPIDQTYYHHIAVALKDVKEILVVGPSYAKKEFIKHVQQHDISLSKKIAGFSVRDQATDSEIVTFARKFFKAYDKMLG